MNERIRELAIQSGLNAPYGSDHEGLRDFDYRKFAELIVRESIVDFYRRYLDLEGEEDITKQVNRYVKDNFGVKECEHEYDHNGECLKCDEPAWTNSNEPSEK